MLQLLTIIVMCILCGAEIDLYVPSFPELQQQFGLTAFMVELTLAINLVAHCCTSLVVGNLGDRYGRKPVILAGLSVFVIGSLMCVFADAYWHLLLGRFLQGAGISAPAVLSYLIISDMYPVERQQQLLGTINGVITMAMAMAPVVGSYVSLYFHWQGNFVVLLGLGLLSLALAWFCVPAGKPNPNLRLSVREYGVVFQSSKAMAYIFTLCFICLGYWTFIGLSPILYMGDLGVSLGEFGFYQGAICAVFSISSFSAGALIRRFGQWGMLQFSMGLLVLFSALVALLIVTGIQSPVLITISMCIMGVGVLFPITILYPMMLDALPEAKARVSAIFVAMRLVMTAGLIQLVSFYYTGSYSLIGLAMLGSMVGVYICYRWLFNADEGLKTALQAPPSEGVTAAAH